MSDSKKIEALTNDLTEQIFRAVEGSRDYIEGQGEAYGLNADMTAGCLRLALIAVLSREIASHLSDTSAATVYREIVTFVSSLR